jgi:predicted RNase H-like nuclease
LLALGVDVSAGRGLDLVAIDERRVPVEVHRAVAVDSLPEVVQDLEPEVVAIDSPPSWGVGGGSRAAERRLAGIGIHSFGTPTKPRAGDNPFYDWMRVGFRAFEALDGRFPRYREGTVHRTAMEVFPHATAVVLAGCLPPRGVTKNVWRRSVLGSKRVATEGLRSLDQIDAALAALTGHFALQGRFTAVGDPDEGVIVVPAKTLPRGRYRLCERPVRPSSQPHLPGLTPCGCGVPGCTAFTRAEFARGHDAKRKSALWRQVRLGDEAARELRRREWQLPPEIR